MKTCLVKIFYILYIYRIYCIYIYIYCIYCIYIVYMYIMHDDCKKRIVAKVNQDNSNSWNILDRIHKGDDNIFLQETFFCYYYYYYYYYYLYYYYYYFRVFLMDTNNSQDIRGREGTIFYSTVSLPPTQEHSDTYLHLCMWDDLLFLGSFSCHWHFSLTSQIYQLWGLPKLLFVAFFFT